MRPDRMDWIKLDEVWMYCNLRYTLTIIIT